MSALEEALVEAEEAVHEVELRTVLALHRPRTVKCVPAECYDACPHEEQGVLCPDVEVTVCAECWDVAECSYPYFAETGGWDHIVYPCPTVRAIEGALQ